MKQPPADDVPLKPCPFCGGEAGFSEGTQGDEPWFYIECLDCAAMAESDEIWNTRKVLPSEYVPSEFKEALHLLEACRGCDLVYEAWPAFGSGNVVHGVTITDQTNISDVVDAFLKRHISPNEGKS